MILKSSMTQLTALHWPRKLSEICLLGREGNMNRLYRKKTSTYKYLASLYSRNRKEQMIWDTERFQYLVLWKNEKFGQEIFEMDTDDYCFVIWKTLRENWISMGQQGAFLSDAVEVSLICSENKLFPFWIYCKVQGKWALINHFKYFLVLHSKHTKHDLTSKIL